MTIKVVKDSVRTADGLFMAHTSQNILEVSDSEGKRLIAEGLAEPFEKVPEQPAAPTESSGVILQKISEVEQALETARGEQKTLLDASRKDPLNVSKKLEAVKTRIGSLDEVLSQLKSDLLQSQAVERLAAEKQAISDIAAVSEKHGKRAKVILRNIVDAISTLDSSLTALEKLYRDVDANFITFGGAADQNPLLQALSVHLPECYGAAFEGVKFFAEAAAASIEKIDTLVSQTPEALRRTLAMGHMKSEQELTREYDAYLKAEREKPQTFKVLPYREDWTLGGGKNTALWGQEPSLGERTRKALTEARIV